MERPDLIFLINPNENRHVVGEAVLRSHNVFHIALGTLCVPVRCIALSADMSHIPDTTLGTVKGAS